MVYSAELDLFAVITATSEVKLFKIGAPSKTTQGKEIILEKALTLTGQANEAISVHMHGKLCISVG